jgi:serine/threonine protein kinase
MVQRFFAIEDVYGVPFILSRKRDCTLFDLIEEGPLPVEDAISCAVQVAHALAYCQSRGLVAHQDLKPENIFVDRTARRFRVNNDYTPRYLAFVADFGLANANLILGRPSGSRPYMPPEQHVSAIEARTAQFGRVDSFALGVNLFEMLTGGMHPVGVRRTQLWPTPGEGQSRKWVGDRPWKAWAKGGPTYDRDVIAALGPDLVAILDGCLCPESAKRASMSVLEGQLTHALHRRDPAGAENLQTYFELNNKAAIESEDAGWPHMEQLMRNVERWYLGS